MRGILFICLIILYLVSRSLHRVLQTPPEWDRPKILIVVLAWQKEGAHVEKVQQGLWYALEDGYFQTSLWVWALEDDLKTLRDWKKYAPEVDFKLLPQAPTTPQERADWYNYLLKIAYVGDYDGILFTDSHTRLHGYALDYLYQAQTPISFIPAQTPRNPQRQFWIREGDALREKASRNYATFQLQTSAFMGEFGALLIKREAMALPFWVPEETQTQVTPSLSPELHGFGLSAEGQEMPIQAFFLPALPLVKIEAPKN